MNVAKLQGKRLLLILVLAGMSTTRSVAQGNLLLTPQRVVFEGSKRIEELNLANIGRDTARFLISLMNLRMTGDGNFEQITQPDTGQNFADKWVRFFPHSVVLGPGESQAVKIQLIKPGAMGPGEYRSHMYFRAIPDEEPLGTKDTTRDSAAISVRLIPIFGISLPVIIRVGDNNTQTTLSDLSLEMGKDTTPVLSMAFRRTGTMSVYGDILVDHIPDPGKRSVRVGVIRGIAVYAPNTIRRFRMPLENIPGTNYHSGKLHVVYMTSSDHKPAMIAEADLLLH
jgi:hypothetical protein